MRQRADLDSNHYLLMKNLTDWFSKVFVINCAHRPDRLETVMKHLDETGMADTDKVTVFNAIVGDWTTVPADWNSGRGAWGCLRSHQHIFEQVLHERDPDRDWDLVHDHFLVLEDDVMFTEDALPRLNEFMEKVPDDWGQIYLGGQHRRPTEETSVAGVRIGRSVNRTHAYAVHRPSYHRIYQHICYATDYRGTKKHVDHQLELAHQRKDWAVYVPDKWIAGQRAGSSNISGKENPDKFWF